MARRRLICIVLLVVVLLLGIPAAIAERYTSPNQDGEYLLNPIKSYGFVFTVARVSGSAIIGSSGKALTRAKVLFETEPARANKVELVYLPDSKPYSYVSRSGKILNIAAPPKLVWEVWGDSPADVIGFLDYVSGARLGASP